MSIRTHRVELIIFLCALLVHALCFLWVLWANDVTLTEVVRVDDGYFELAQNVLAGNGFSWSTEAPYAPNPLRTPGFAYVLAGLIGLVGVTGASVIHLILSSCIPVLGFRIARALQSSERVAHSTAIILICDPTLALLSFQFYTDSLFALLFLTWLLVTLRYFTSWNVRDLMFGAFLLGLATLVRPVTQYLPFVLAVCIVWHFGVLREWKRAATHVCVYACIVAAVLAPWLVRNAQQFGVPGLSAQSAFVLYTNFAPAVLSVSKGTDFLTERDAFLTPREFKGDEITLANAGVYTGKAVAIMLAHPLATSYLMVKSLFTFFTNDGWYTFIARVGGAPADFYPLLISARLCWILLSSLACVGAYVYLASRRSLTAVFVILLVVYFAGTSMAAAYGTNPRYRLPVDPILITLACTGAVNISEYFTARYKKVLA